MAVEFCSVLLRLCDVLLTSESSLTVPQRNCFLLSYFYNMETALDIDSVETQGMIIREHL